MAAACYNLKRLLKWMSEDIENAGKSLTNDFFRLWLSLIQYKEESRLAMTVSK